MTTSVFCFCPKSKDSLFTVANQQQIFSSKDISMGFINNFKLNVFQLLDRQNKTFEDVEVLHGDETL